MANIHILRLMCANHHVMMAVTWNAAESEYVDVLKAFQITRDAGRATGFFKGRCGHCHNPDLRFEDLETPYNTMAEFQPHQADYVRQWQHGGIT